MYLVHSTGRYMERNQETPIHPTCIPIRSSDMRGQDDSNLPSPRCTVGQMTSVKAPTVFSIPIIYLPRTCRRCRQFYDDLEASVKTLKAPGLQQVSIQDSGKPPEGIVITHHFYALLLRLDNNRWRGRIATCK